MKYFNKLAAIGLAFAVVGGITATTIPDAAAKNYMKWTDVSQDEHVVRFKNWPGAEKCRFRKKMNSRYSQEATVGFCPAYPVYGDPRTYLRVLEIMPGYFWGGGYSNDFSKHPILTGKAKGSFFQFFHDAKIDPGQKTECYADEDCRFRRITFSVGDNKCQWVFYLPALGRTSSDNAATTQPFGVELWTCDFQQSFTEENFEISEKKVVIKGFAASDNPKKASLKTEPQISNGAESGRFIPIIQEELAQKYNKKNIVPLSSDSTKEKRSIAVQWGGKDSLLAGHVTIPKSGAGDITFSMPGTGGKCSGTFVYTETTKGIWSAACTSGETASGSFTALGAGNGSTGTGKDNKGNTVRFTIGAR